MFIPIHDLDHLFSEVKEMFTGVNSQKEKSHTMGISLAGLCVLVIFGPPLPDWWVAIA